MTDSIHEDAQGYISTSSHHPSKPVQHSVWIVGGIIYLAVGLVILTFNQLLPVGDTVRFAEGDIPDEDIFAPEDRTYESAVLTEQARQEARQSVTPMYDRLPEVARDQVEITRRIIDYIRLIQNDPYATPEQKLNDFTAIESLQNIPEDTWQELLEANSFRWTNITNEILNVLQRVMISDIRPNGIEEVRRSLISYVDPTFSDTDQMIVISVVGELIAPNTQLNEARTEEARAAAAANVQPRFRTFQKNEIVVTQGKRVTAVDIEALRQFGLIETGQSDWRIFASTVLILLAVSGSQLAYVMRFYPSVFISPRLMIVIPTMFLIFLSGALAFGPGGLDRQNIYPAAALALLVTSLVGPHLATIMVAGLALLVGVMFDNSLELAILITVGGITAVLTLRDIERLNSYFLSGVGIGAANMVVVTAFMLASPDNPNFLQITTNALVGFGNGILAAGIALVGLFFIGTTANLTTSVRLIELLQPNQPLLQLLLRKAPGTYQHSLQVANLAELAAERIGANGTLVRVAAMYHDIGKTLNPHFFVENQAEGINLHDELNNPIRSAQLIIGHVWEGERLARHYRLPQRIRDFIREHHGTTKPMFFYYRALEQVNGDPTKVDIKQFTYPGPSPQSKETAILMLADATESTARATKPRNHLAIEEIVNKIFGTALSDGQLDESHLTLNDLKAVREVFIETLQAIYHERIDYRPPKLSTQDMPRLEEVIEAEISEVERELSEVGETIKESTKVRRSEAKHRPPHEEIKDDY